LSSELHILTPAGKIMMLTAPSKQEAAKLTASLNLATMHSLIAAHQAQVATKNKAKGDKANKSTNNTSNKNDPLDGLDLTKQRKEKLFARTVAQLTPLEQRKRRCRLIIRNLSFQATEQNVLDKMSKFGPIVSIELPMKIPEKKEGELNKFAAKRDKEPTARPMGFGFATFLCESDAQAAVDSCAGADGTAALKICNREVAIDFCMSKETYEKYGKQNNNSSITGNAEEDTAAATAALKASAKDKSEEKEEESGSEDENDDEDNDMDEEEDEEEESDEDEEDDEDEEGEDEGEDEDSEEEEDEDAPKKRGGASADTSGNSKESMKDKEKDKEPAEDVHEGCTVFLRGLPFDADPADLKRALGRFGRIVMAVIVKDKITDMSKGSAFVKFALPECAAACVGDSLLSGGVTVKDRLCKVDLAVDRQAAGNIKDSEAAKRGKDKRNLYLANEGLIVPDTEAAAAAGTGAKVAHMTEGDKEKRQRAQTEKKKKLQNPLFFVSPTRLAIRNLPKAFTDRELRELCLNAAKTGIKKGIVKRTDMEQFRAAQGSEYIMQQHQLLSNGKVVKPGSDLDAVPPAVGKNCLKGAKIMLDMQRIRGGAPQSRGYGFADFTHHAHALACLRELNNSKAPEPAAGSAGSSSRDREEAPGKLIVEFSLENMQKVCT
jgi:nucleolar protein 4